MISSEKAADEAEAQKEKDAIAAAKPGKAKAKLVQEAKNKEKARTKKKLAEEALRIKRAQPTVITQAFRMWNPNSMNNPKKYPYTAAGLTQFIASTWVGEALRKGTVLCEQAITDGCVKDLPNQLTAEQIAKNDEIGKKNAKISDKKKHLPLIKPQPGTSLQVVNEKLVQLLDMRFNPRISILSSIDYAVENLRQFTKSYNEPKVMENHANKAKLMYLTHHLGLGDAIKFMGNKIKEEDTPILNKDGTPKKYKGKPVVINGAETLLRAQFAASEHPEQADAWYEINNDNWIWAHRSWLINLIDRKVDLKRFACVGATLPEAGNLFDMIKTLGGQHPEDFIVRLPRN